MTQELSLRFDRPAGAWTEALPVGNGRLGAMVFGGTVVERLQLNEESVWDGRARDRNNPAALEALPDVRRLLFEGRNQEATELAQRTMLAMPLRVDSYQPLADVHLTLLSPAGGAVERYERLLDLDEGMALVQFETGGVQCRREVFASAIDQVVVARLTCTHPNGLHVRVQLSRESDAETRLDGTDLVLTGQCSSAPGHVRFACRVRVIAEGAGAHVRADGASLLVTQADALTLLIAGHTDFVRPWIGPPPDLDPELAGRGTIDAASQKPYPQLRADHVQDHQRLFRRFSVSLGQDAEAQQMTLQVQLNRYLLLGASRPGCLPSTLQGIWNDQLKAPWNSDYHPNINLQMNYWPSEAVGLAECHTPLFDWLEHIIVPRGRETARKTYGCGGWVMHHVSDIFGSTEPMDGIHGLWPAGGCWLVRHLWEHFLHTGDRAFLRDRAWPLMRESARFLLDFLVEAPAGTPMAGCLVTNPSHSPENAFRKPDGIESKFTYAATMDLQIARDLFSSCLSALGVLAIEDEIGEEITITLERLAPLQVSPRDGRLQEWIEDYNEPQPGHRHISHMYGVYPGREITLDGTPQLAAAARASLERKLASNYDAQAWSLHWMSCVWARLGDGDRAYEALSRALAEYTFPNGFVNAHGHAQMGDAIGFTAAVCEMLVQTEHDPVSDKSTITLLPALPAAWPQGAVQGLRTRGGYEVDLIWRDGRVYQYAIRPDISDLLTVQMAVGREPA